jgi:hypothetical protein
MVILRYRGCCNCEDVKGAYFCLPSTKYKDIISKHETRAQIPCKTTGCSCLSLRTVIILPSPRLPAVLNMRVRYWRLSITDVLHATYPAEKANHWDIKCMQGEYEHFGVFWYRYGTPFDKEPVHGICFYYNDVSRKIIDDLASFLQSNFGGKLLSLHSRGFLKGSKEFADGRSIGTLANELSLRFSAPVELTIEFEKMTKEDIDQESFKLPSSKALPISGSD